VYVPRLRRIKTVLKEIKAADPQTVISRWFIVQLIRSQEITPLKYGDAWLINTDELFGYLSGCMPQDLNYKPLIKRDLMTSGEIYRLFLHADNGTIIRKPNMRRFTHDNGIWHFISACGRWIIDFNAFMESVNPRHINERVETPRLRWHDDSVRNFKRTHPELPVTITIAEQAFKSDNVFKTLNGHRWIINYDQLEKEVLRIINAKQPPT